MPKFKLGGVPEMTFVRSGMTRFVVLTRLYAIKFPYFGRSWRMGLNGLLANMQEAEWSLHAEGHPRLCPVLWAAPGGWCVVMPRLKIVDKEYWHDSMLELEVEDWGIPADTKPENYGWYEGRVVAVDYGS